MKHQLVKVIKTLDARSESDRQYAREHLIGAYIIPSDITCCVDRVKDDLENELSSGLFLLDDVESYGFKTSGSHYWRYISVVEIIDLVGLVITKRTADYYDASKYIGKTVEYWNTRTDQWDRDVLNDVLGSMFGNLFVMDGGYMPPMIKLVPDTFKDPEPTKPCINIKADVEITINGKKYQLEEK
jgi:hypothetical protein